jgi:hypothetical protein
LGRLSEEGGELPGVARRYAWFLCFCKESGIKAKFLEQINLCWLYGPDEVIRKANDFLAKVEQGAEDRELAAGKFVLPVRRDLVSQGFRRTTDLKAEEFQHYAVPK